MKSLKREVVTALVLAAMFVLIVLTIQFLQKDSTRFIYQSF